MGIWPAMLAPTLWLSGGNTKGISFALRGHKPQQFHSLLVLSLDLHFDV